jgi:hypothetical protein
MSSAYNFPWNDLCQNFAQISRLKAFTGLFHEIYLIVFFYLQDFTCR